MTFGSAQLSLFLHPQVVNLHIGLQILISYALKSFWPRKRGDYAPKEHGQTMNGAHSSASPLFTVCCASVGQHGDSDVYVFEGTVVELGHELDKCNASKEKERKGS